MPRPLQNVNLKTFCVACRHSMRKFANKIGAHVDIAIYILNSSHLEFFWNSPILLKGSGECLTCMSSTMLPRSDLSTYVDLAQMYCTLSL